MYYWGFLCIIIQPKIYRLFPTSSLREIGHTRRALPTFSCINLSCSVTTTGLTLVILFVRSHDVGEQDAPLGVSGLGTRALDELRGCEKAMKTEENVRAGEGRSNVVVGWRAVKDKVQQGLGGLDVADVPRVIV